MRFSKFNLTNPQALVAVFLLLIAGYSQAMPELQELLTYNKAALEFESISANKVHQVVLSAPTRINNAPFIEKEQRVEGQKTTMLLRLDNTDSATEAFVYYQAVINKHGAVAYSCEKRGCGVSSYWANSIFDERRLAGRDSDQYYVAGQIEFAGAQYWVSVYLVTNALRQNLVHVNYIQQSGQKQAWENAYLLSPESKLPAPVLRELSEQLKNDAQLALYLVGYSKFAKDKRVQSQEAQLQSAYQRLNKELAMNLSVQPERLKFYFVGPLHTEAPTQADIWFRLFLLKP